MDNFSSQHEISRRLSDIFIKRKIDVSTLLTGISGFTDRDKDEISEAETDGYISVMGVLIDRLMKMPMWKERLTQMIMSQECPSDLYNQVSKVFDYKHLVKSKYSILKEHLDALEEVMDYLIEKDHNRIFTSDDRQEVSSYIGRRKQVECLLKKILHSRKSQESCRTFLCAITEIGSQKFILEINSKLVQADNFKVTSEQITKLRDKIGRDSDRRLLIEKLPETEDIADLMIETDLFSIDDHDDIMEEKTRLKRLVAVLDNVKDDDDKLKLFLQVCCILEPSLEGSITSVNPLVFDCNSSLDFVRDKIKFLITENITQLTLNMVHSVDIGAGLGLKYIPNLRVLEMNGCGLTDVGLQVLAGEMIHLKSLVVIDFGNNHFTTKGLRNLLELDWRLKNISAFRVQKIKFGPEGGKVLAELLKRMPKIEILNLSGCGLQDGVQPISEVLADRKIHRINLRENKIGLDQSKYLFKSLSKSRCLQYLDYSGNEIGLLPLNFPRRVQFIPGSVNKLAETPVAFIELEKSSSECWDYVCLWKCGLRYTPQFRDPSHFNFLKELLPYAFRKMNLMMNLQWHSVPQ